MRQRWIESAAATALAGCLAAIGFASASYAGNYFSEDVDFLIRNRMIENLILLGGSFYTDGNWCREAGVMGYADRDKSVVACVENHGGDREELMDTIRHELVHVAQGCKARREGERYAALRPDLTIFYQGYARDYLGWNRLGYNMEQWDTESEARVLAQVLDESAIIQVLLAECSHGS